MTSVPLDAELARLRECQDRVLEREGIPMVLALVSEVGEMPSAMSDDVRAEGTSLAQSMDRVRSAVAADQPRRRHGLPHQRPAVGVLHRLRPRGAVVNPLTYSAHRASIAEGRFVRVVNYHNTPMSGMAALREELGAYARRFASISLEELDGFFATGTLGERPAGFPAGVLRGLPQQRRGRRAGL